MFSPYFRLDSVRQRRTNGRDSQSLSRDGTRKRQGAFILTRPSSCRSNTMPQDQSSTSQPIPNPRWLSISKFHWHCPKRLRRRPVQQSSHQLTCIGTLAVYLLSLAGLFCVLHSQPTTASEYSRNKPTRRSKS